MSSVDLYDILDLEPDCSQQDIIKAYRKLVKKYHPDKPDGDVDLFELINLAFEKLSDSKKRKEYDALKQMSNASNKKHHTRRAEFEEFDKLQTASNTEKTKADAKIAYNKHYSSMDAKHKYVRNDDNTEEINEKDASKLYKDLELMREDDDIENIQERLFEQGNFNLEQFNQAFEEAHGSTSDLIVHEGNPGAWTAENTQYGSYNGNYEDVYMDDEMDNTFVLDGDKMGNVNFGKEYKPLSVNDVKNMKGKSDVFGHNEKDEDYNEQLKQMAQERMNDRKKDLNMDLKDYKTDVDMDGYGIFNQLGHDGTSTIEWEDEDTIKSKYEKLLESRSKK